jgi:erythronate-4-phosphate dehydrogenase
MKKQVLFYDELIPLPEEFLSQFVSIKFKAKELNNKILIENKCNILLSRSTLKINKNLLTNVPLQYYATATAGFDHVDIDYLISNDIQYFFSSGCNSNSVAEYVMINIQNHLSENNLSPKTQTIGIIGYGNIGKKVAHYSKLLALKVIVNDPPLSDMNYNFPADFKYVELNNLLTNSDIITNHIPLTKDGKYKSHNLLNENLELIKQDSLFLHCSRGGIVNEVKLLQIKKEKNLTLITDVWENEPVINHELLDISEISTPHIAGHSINAKINASNMIMEDLFIKKLIDKKHNLDVSVVEISNSLNILLKLEKAKKERKIEKDSEMLKRNKNIFTSMRSNYPIRYESLKID